MQIQFPEVSNTIRDYSGNIQATDRAWFYPSPSGALLYTVNGEIQGGFITNPLCPAGQSSADPNNYLTFGFSNHVVVGIGATRFDASSSYLRDPFGVLHMNPPTPFPYSEYWQNIIGGIPFRLNSTVPSPPNVPSVRLFNQNALQMTDFGGH